MVGDDYDLFLSYQSTNEGFAEKLASTVENHEYDGRNLRVFYAPWDIEPGDNIVAKIEEGLDEARFVGIVLSPDYIDADWTTAERAAAVYDDPSGRLGRIIPIMHEKCEIPPLLRFRRYVDFAELKFDKALEHLIAILKGESLQRGETKEGAETTDVGTDLASRRLNAAKPDRVQETLNSNLFQVDDLPKKVWTAPTRFRTKGDLLRYYGRNVTVPPCILRDERLYTFLDLTQPDNTFVGVIEEYDVWSESVDDWLDDPDKRYYLLSLLNDCIRVLRFERRLAFDKKGEKNYYPEGVLEDVQFKAHNRGRGKNLILDYSKAGYKAHRAVGLRFKLLGDKPFLRIEPGWVFTTDGSTRITGRQRSVLNTKFLSDQRNPSHFNEVRFWAWFLSENDNQIKFDIGDDTLDVSITPAKTQINVGIFGDERNFSPVVDEPPEIGFVKSQDDGQNREGDSDD